MNCKKAVQKDGLFFIYVEDTPWRVPTFVDHHIL